ncbi:uncharacterized protein [Epargyreus clarus]|uniref:uncharacterized protein n=1 Tax=Epargyreus clarus TaxID=520877 RepID=UPI003C2FFDC3
MEPNDVSRENQLTHLETYLNEVDTEVTMILQSLQWDRKHLSEQRTMVACQYNAHHRVPPDKLMEHERGCFLKSQGYMDEDRLLPSPVDPGASTLVKLSAENITEIINNASRNQALFKSGPGCSGHQPLTLERLQSTYTADERRTLHDAVVAQVPSSHDLSDLEILSAKDESKESKPKSKLEILAELRDMKRRRTKYRVAAKTRNYSDVLRDVIITQMELYTQAQDSVTDRIKKEKDNIKEVTENAYYGKVSYHYESRKRRHNDTYDTYNSGTLSKTQERDRATTSKAYEHRDNMPHASNSKRYDYSTSDKRDDRHTKHSRANRDEHYDDYERRKKHRDKHSDHRRESHNKTDSLIAPKDIKKEKGDLSNDGSSGSADKQHDCKLSKDKHYRSKRHYSNIQRERQKHERHENSCKNGDGKINKKYYDEHKQKKTEKKESEKYSHNDDSYSSDDNELEYTERCKSHKSKRKHHSYKTHYSKVEENVREEESDVSSCSEEDIKRKYNRHCQRHKEKYRRSGRNKSKDSKYEKDNTHRR